MYSIIFHQNDIHILNVDIILLFIDACILHIHAKINQMNLIKDSTSCKHFHTHQFDMFSCSNF